LFNVARFVHGGDGKSSRWRFVAMKLLPRLTIVEWLAIFAMMGFFSTFAYDERQARLGARDGRKEADVDITAGALKLKCAGKPPYCRDHIVAIYQERYGISFEYVGGCCPSSYRSAYNRAYNDRMHMAIRRIESDFDPVAAYHGVYKLATARREAEWNSRQP
jgi:hypothetical protein